MSGDRLAGPTRRLSPQLPRAAPCHGPFPVRSYRPVQSMRCFVRLLVDPLCLGGNADWPGSDPHTALDGANKRTRQPYGRGGKVAAFERLHDRDAAEPVIFGPRPY